MRFLNFFLLIGISFGFLSFLLYHFFGYSNYVLILWLFSILFSGIFFFKKDGSRRMVDVNTLDIYAILILLVIFIPLYLVSLYTIPFQVNTDEIVVMSFAKTALNKQSDLLGISPALFGMPTLIFAFYGHLANLLGGVNLLNTRLIHATFGILIILISYYFFKLSLPTKFAVGASLILGFSHSLLAISRLAMRDNSGLFTEITALFFLTRGLIKKSNFSTFIGGIFLGLSFYVYFPGRIVILIWFLYLMFYFLLFKRNTLQSVSSEMASSFAESRIKQGFEQEDPASRKSIVSSFLNKLKKKAFIKQILVCFLGFTIVVTPVLISSFKQPAGVFIYQKQQILIFPEGREMQQSWVYSPTITEGLKKNLLNSLTSLNNNISDYAYIYSNLGHGFVDPITGILVWIGFLLVLFKKNKNEVDLLSIAGLLVILLVFGLLINKAPDYTRLLVVLPFVAYFCIQPVYFVSNLTTKVMQGKWSLFLSMSFLLGSISSLMLINIFIYKDFVLKGFREGDNVGGTFRYVEKRNNLANYTFYIAANDSYLYYTWGDISRWKVWVGFAANSAQQVQYIDPISLGESYYNPPFSIFLNRSLFELKKGILANLYPTLQIHNIKPDGSLIAIEVN